MRTHRALWVVQGLLAVVFLLSGMMKLLTPPEVMAAQMALPLPIWFVQFVSVCEVLGALGLVLPGLLRIHTALTAWAALGLAVLMAGAVAVTLLAGMGAAAVLPLVLGILAALVAWGRRTAAPLPTAPRFRRMQPAA